ncbi:hypothetical protein SAMN05720762_103140 [Fibrobacter sp. UWH4]|nr:hypothetical protein SAMN05720762_103140 [Fibrobacter sp. UWH4]
MTEHKQLLQNVRSITFIDKHILFFILGYKKNRLPMIRYLLFLLFLVPTVHAITCTEGLLMLQQSIFGLYFNEDASFDGFRVNYINSEDFESQKLIYEKEKILKINESFNQGNFNSDTSLFFYLINDISNPADSSIAYKKSFLGDTVVIEAIVDEPDYEEDSRISQQSIKMFKNGVVNRSWESNGENDSYEGYTEIILRKDTLFRLNLGSEDGAPMDTVDFHFYVAEKDNKHICHEYYKVYDCWSNSCSDKKEIPSKKVT